MTGGAAGERVQRLVDGPWPVVHLESSVPAHDGSLRVGGLVDHGRRFSLGALRAIDEETRGVALHCVWGWSRPDVTWIGVGMDKVLDLVGAHGSHVTIEAAGGAYSACLAIDAARAGFLAWGRDGDALSADAGAPLRFLPPPTYWGYKGVKWATRIVVRDRFVAGFWESRVADPIGVIPDEVRLP